MYQKVVKFFYKYILKTFFTIIYSFKIIIYSGNNVYMCAIALQQTVNDQTGSVYIYRSVIVSNLFSRVPSFRFNFLFFFSFVFFWNFRVLVLIINIFHGIIYTIIPWLFQQTHFIKILCFSSVDNIFSLQLGHICMYVMYEIFQKMYFILF